MKTLRLLSLAACTLLLASCHDDNDNDTPLPLQQQTFEGRTALDLEYNDIQVAGKRVTVTPGTGSEATLTFDSQVSLASLNDAFKDLEPVAGPGVLPGTPVLKLTLPLGTDGDEYTFSHSGETEFVTYSMHGEFDAREMDVEFDNVRLKNQTFAGGAWKPVAAPANPLDASQPFHIVWGTEAPVQLPGLQYTVEDLLRIIVNAPIIPAYNNTAAMSLSQVIANGLKTIGMGADGNITVTYLQTANGAAQITRAPLCAFQYVPLSNVALKLYANPTDLLTLVLLNNTNRDPNIPAHPFGKNSRAGMLVDELKQLVVTLTPMLADGLPMACVRHGNSMSLYLTSELMLPLLKQSIIPILQNPAMRGIVEDYVMNNQQLAPHAAEILLLYDNLSLIFNQTTKMELGLNFVKA